MCAFSESAFKTRDKTARPPVTRRLRSRASWPIAGRGSLAPARGSAGSPRAGQRAGAGAGLRRRHPKGAVPFQEANRSRSVNRRMSSTSASSRAAPQGPIPVRSISVDPRASTRSCRPFSVVLIFLSMPSSSSIRSTASRRRVLPTMSRGWIMAISLRALLGGQEPPGSTGESSSSKRCSRFAVWVRSVTTATEYASTGSVLRPLPAANTRTRADSYLIAGLREIQPPSTTSPTGVGSRRAALIDSFPAHSERPTQRPQSQGPKLRLRRSSE